MQAEVTYLAPPACFLMNATVSPSAMASATPNPPPGTHRRSSWGQSRKLVVWTKLRPQSLGAGSSVFAGM